MNRDYEQIAFDELNNLMYLASVASSNGSESEDRYIRVAIEVFFAKKALETHLLYSSRIEENPGDYGYDYGNDFSGGYFGGAVIEEKELVKILTDEEIMYYNDIIAEHIDYIDRNSKSSSNSIFEVNDESLKHFAKYEFLSVTEAVAFANKEDGGFDDKELVFVTNANDAGIAQSGLQDRNGWAFYIWIPDEKKYYEVTAKEGGFIIDDKVSDFSTNAVQNKIIKEYVDDLIASGGGGSGGTRTDLSVSRSSTSLTIANSGGDNAVLDVATTSLAGIMSANDKTKLDTLDSTYAKLGGDLSQDFSVKNLLVKEDIGSVDFISGIGGVGWKLNGNGDSFFNNMEVRGNISCSTFVNNKIAIHLSLIHI